MKKFKNIHIFVFLSVLSISSYGQPESDFFVQNNSLFKKNSSWVTLGLGYGFNTFEKNNEWAGSIIYHANIKKVSLMTGYHLFTNESFIAHSYHSMTNFSIGGGLRKETEKTNMAGYIGPLYAFGKKEIQGDKYYIYNGLGFFINLEYTYKKFYDLGIGTSLFYNFSSYYQVIGIKLHLYFSGAFKAGVKNPKMN